jgi:hypothetical protein
MSELMERPGGSVADHPGPAEESGALLAIIARAASDPNTDVAKMKELLDMHERILNRQAEGAFNASLARLSAHMPRVKKNGTITLTRKDGSSGGSIPFAR